MVVFSQEGWLADELRTYTDWKISYQADWQALAAGVRTQLEDGPGFALITGSPVRELTADQACEFAPALMGHLGEPLMQGPKDEAQLGWIIQDEGAVRFNPDGTYARGVYSSRSADYLDLHNDAAMRPHGHDLDYFGLLCLSSAAQGGTTRLVSTLAVVEVLRREYPLQLARLFRPFVFERSHVVARGEEPLIQQPVFAIENGRLRVRCNRQRIEMAAELTAVPIGDDGIAALDAMDSVVARSDLQFRFQLSEGDFLIADDHRVLHGRDSFVDDYSIGRRRLVRVVLSRTIRKAQLF